jgi:hypothetical protein
MIIIILFNSTLTDLKADTSTSLRYVECRNRNSHCGLSWGVSFRYKKNVIGSCNVLTQKTLKWGGEFIQQYFELQKERNENKILLNIGIKNADKYKVIPVSLQILIENAIKTQFCF